MAKADPERWSATHTRCGTCGGSLCDRCAPGGATQCARCGEALDADAAEDEGLSLEQRERLVFARRWLLASALATVAMTIGLAANQSAPTVLGLLFALLCGYSGVAHLVAATGGLSITPWLAVIGLFPPIVNLPVAGFFLWRAHAKLSHFDEQMRAATLRASARARRSAAPSRPASIPPQVAPAASPAPQPVSPPVGRPPAKSAAPTPRASAPAPLASARPREAADTVPMAGAETAIAYLKQALPGVPDGANVRVRIPATGLPPGDVPGDDEPVFAVHNGFGLFFVMDRGDSLAYVNHGAMRAAGLSPQSLLQTGLANLTAVANGSNPGLRVRPVGGVYGLLVGGNFEASLVVLDALWEQLKSHAPNGLVMTVPARDICAFCDAHSAEGIAELEKIAARVTATGERLISPKLWVRRAGRWIERI